MSNIQKWEMVRTKLLADPGLSDREIANSCNVSPTLVGRVRLHLEERKEILIVGKRRGKDGKERRTSEEITKQCTGRGKKCRRNQKERVSCRDGGPSGQTSERMAGSRWNS